MKAFFYTLSLLLCCQSIAAQNVDLRTLSMQSDAIVLISGYESSYTTANDYTNRRHIQIETIREIIKNKYNDDLLNRQISYPLHGHDYYDMSGINCGEWGMAALAPLGRSHDIMLFLKKQNGNYSVLVELYMDFEWGTIIGSIEEVMKIDSITDTMRRFDASLEWYFTHEKTPTPSSVFMEHYNQWGLPVVPIVAPDFSDDQPDERLKNVIRVATQSNPRYWSDYTQEWDRKHDTIINNYTHIPYTGSVVIYADSINIDNSINNNINHTHKLYYRDGLLTSLDAYYPNGQLQHLKTYLKKAQWNKYDFYDEMKFYENGTLKESTYIIDSSNLLFKSTCYYESGNIKSEGMIRYIAQEFKYPACAMSAFPTRKKRRESKKSFAKRLDPMGYWSTIYIHRLKTGFWSYYNEDGTSLEEGVYEITSNIYGELEDERIGEWKPGRDAPKEIKPQPHVDLRTLSLQSDAIILVEDEHGLSYGTNSDNDYTRNSYFTIHEITQTLKNRYNDTLLNIPLGNIPIYDNASINDNQDYNERGCFQMLNPDSTYYNMLFLQKLEGQYFVLAHLWEEFDWKAIAGAIESALKLEIIQDTVARFEYSKAWYRKYLPKNNVMSVNHSFVSYYAQIGFSVDSLSLLPQKDLSVVCTSDEIRHMQWVDHCEELYLKNDTLFNTCNHLPSDCSIYFYSDVLKNSRSKIGYLSLSDGQLSYMHINHPNEYRSYQAPKPYWLNPCQREIFYNSDLYHEDDRTRSIETELIDARTLSFRKREYDKSGALKAEGTIQFMMTGADSGEFVKTGLWTYYDPQGIRYEENKEYYNKLITK